MSQDIDVKRTEETMSRAIDDVTAERQRQITTEGWTPEHDDEHAHGEMAKASACYAYCSTETDQERKWRSDAGRVPLMWPWDNAWWKPKDRRRDLVRAAALLIAEIERLDRLNT